MAIWKLTRLKYGDEEFELTVGDKITVGRASTNSITLEGSTVSRTHCLLQVENNYVLVTDLKSSNGTYIGNKKIPPNKQVPLKESNTIGIGTLFCTNIEDKAKFIFELKRINFISNKLQVKNEIFESKDHIDIEIAKLHGCEPNIHKETSPFICAHRSLKRKLDVVPSKISKENPSTSSSAIIDIRNNDNNIITLSDDENDVILVKKQKHEENKTESNVLKINTSGNIKIDNNDVEYEPFSIKQDIFQYDEEPIEIDDDSDSEVENWQIRLSQGSPGKPFFKTESKVKTEDNLNENSYSQIDDPIIDLNEDYSDEDDFIRIKPETPNKESESIDEDKNKKSNEMDIPDKCDDLCNKLLLTTSVGKEPPSDKSHNNQDILCRLDIRKDYVDEKTFRKEPTKPQKTLNVVTSQIQNKEVKKVKYTEALPLAVKKKTCIYEDIQQNVIKVTTSNQGAFLTNTVEFVVNQINTTGDNSRNEKEYENRKKSEKHKSPARRKKKETKPRDERKKNDKKKERKNVTRKSRSKVVDKPNSKDTQDGKIKKTTSTREHSPPPKPIKKSVQFSDMPPTVLEFEIEPGNKMKSLKSINTTLVDSRHKPIISSKKNALQRILKWNPQWLDEQQKYKDPPPILGNRKPMAMLQEFQNHNQYTQVVGDLILMETWESLSNSYLNVCNENELEMRLNYTPSMELHCDVCNFGVDVSVPKIDTRNIPRVGEIMLMSFVQDDVIIRRFFFVNNVKYLPSPPNNANAFLNVSLQTASSERLKHLRVGQVMKGKRLAYINNELSLIEAIEYLARTPLAETILHPSPLHFQPVDMTDLARSFNKSQWCQSLNPSQQVAVGTALSAALSDRPTIKMIQGPPGTGKSRVICSIVMAYLYDLNNKRRQDRGKLLICATSNAAIDEILVRLLDIRKELPKSERIRMVRVGRIEAMRPQARNVSLQTLAERSIALPKETQNPEVADEIEQLVAKVNMWRGLVLEAKTSERAAYCENRVTHFTKRIALIRGAAPTGGNQTDAEHRILCGADLILTTLGSAHTFKMKWLKRQISMCIVDEAGQATEPEALIPLTLDVTRLVLVGDPQQLPGFISSQRARDYGLGESLFSRLASAAEGSSGGAVLLTRQYRMHPAISYYPNRAFYDERIISETPSDGVAARFNLLPYCMLAVPGGDKGQITAGSNELEAWAVAQLVVSLRTSVLEPNLSVAVITPYVAQRDLIRRHLRTLTSNHNLESALGEVEVNTVDSFQGQERDVIVVSVGRLQGVGFLNDVGRMNVMLTRARHALYLLLHPNAFLKNDQWRTLIEDAKRRNLYRTLPASACQPLSSVDSQTILRHISASPT